MAQKRSPARRPDTHEPHAGKGRSADRTRHLEDAKHHTETHPLPHPAHKTLKKPEGLVKHHPHTRPPAEAFDIDHGTHEDRPRPGKLMKKESPHRKTKA